MALNRIVGVFIVQREFSYVVRCTASMLQTGNGVDNFISSCVPLRPI